MQVKTNINQLSYTQCDYSAEPFLERWFQVWISHLFPNTTICLNCNSTFIKPYKERWFPITFRWKPLQILQPFNTQNPSSQQPSPSLHSPQNDTNNTQPPLDPWLPTFADRSWLDRLRKSSPEERANKHMPAIRSNPHGSWLKGTQNPPESFSFSEEVPPEKWWGLED